MDRTKFFDEIRVRPFAGKLSADQVSGIDHILDEWEKRKLTDQRWLAYMLATTFHETAGRMQPIKEMGSEHYLKSKPYWPWIGAGLVQVTWKANYDKFGLTSVNDATTWPDCLKPLFDGMIKGIFTGKKLSDYFDEKHNDPVNARKIINGLDKAAMIAGYHAKFLSAINP